MTEKSDLLARLRSTDSSGVYGALIEIGKSGMRDLENEVALFLKHADPELRGAALRVLAFYWALPTYRERTFELASLDRESDVRTVALLALGSYERGTKSRGVLTMLVATASDPSVDEEVRAAAYHALLMVAGVDPVERALAGTGARIDRIDWAWVRELLTDTGVDVPLYKTSVSARLGVDEVMYEMGAPNHPSAREGKLTVTFHGETGLVELVQEHGTVRRGWMASLPEPTWSNLVATLERCGFPRQPDEQAPNPPGTLSRTIRWERRGIVESVELPGNSADYGEVNKLVLPVIAQIAPDVLIGVPASWSTPDTRIEDPFEVKPTLT